MSVALRLSARGVRALAVGLTMVACGPAQPAAPPAPPAPVASATTTAPPKPIPRVDALATARVYDDKGVASVCGAAKPGCAPLAASSPFLDKCRLLGFTVLQCACEPRCTGDVVAAGKHYDATGQPKDCAPSQPECTPPSPGAAFQDACAEHGFRLDMCGCEMLCSGNFKR